MAGFLRGGLGLGEAGRLYVAALRAAGVPVRTTTVDPRLPTVVGPSGQRAQLKTTEFTDLETDADTPFNLVCVNGPEMPQFVADVGSDFFERRRTIGVLAWEVDRVPASWGPAFDLVDEIWVYSRYVEEIFSRASGLPVFRLPLPVVVPEIPPEPNDLGLGGDYTFLFLFDFYSTTQRKNPLGLIDAFKRAFAPGEGPRLILKSHNGDYKLERLATVEHAAADHPDIQVVDRYLSPAEKDGLMASCDCYVSLHRAEGFGLTLAEAMALGKPVIATGFSGNVDFMTDENSYLVRHAPTEVGPEGENYPPDAIWAEPDLDHAAALMRDVWENRAEARARAERGQAEVLNRLSLEGVGSRAADRLDQLTKAGLARSGAGPRRIRRSLVPEAPVIGQAQRLALHDPLEGARKMGGLKGLWRQLALRAMRPYTYRQEELNAKHVEALRELDGRARALNALVDESLDGADAAIRGRAVSRVLEGMWARPASSHPAISAEDPAGRRVLAFEAAADIEGEDFQFTDVFRGSEDLIADRQRVYVDILNSPRWVLDLGCGRGEFLDVLAERGVAGRGVELSEEMVNRCREKGHDVELGDAVEHLSQLEDSTVPVVFAAQLVEHLPSEVLRRFLELVLAKLEPDGTAVLETVNPHSPAALKAFWTDPTHHHPLFPEVLLALGRFAGFGAGRVMFPAGHGDFNEDIYESADYAVLLTKRPRP